MKKAIDGADFALVRSEDEDVGDDSRGALIGRRVHALGITDREWHAVTGIDRKTLGRAIRNEPGVRPGTFTAIEAELDRLEARNAGGATREVAPGVVRIEVQGVYGTKALILEAGVENSELLEQMVDRIMRRLAEEEQGDAS